MAHLTMRMYCNWPTDHAIDHSSIGLNRLTIQPVFSEVSLFTFSKGTHGFDATVPKNYLNIMRQYRRRPVSLFLLCGRGALRDHGCRGEGGKCKGQGDALSDRRRVKGVAIPF